MTSRDINRICYTVCMVCVVVGTLLALLLIWAGPDRLIAWKGIGSVAVLFCASLFTLAVNAMFAAVRGAPDREEAAEDALEPPAWSPRETRVMKRSAAVDREER